MLDLYDIIEEAKLLLLEDLFLINQSEVHPTRTLFHYNVSCIQQRGYSIKLINLLFLDNMQSSISSTNSFENF